MLEAGAKFHTSNRLGRKGSPSDQSEKLYFFSENFWATKSTKAHENKKNVSCFLVGLVAIIINKSCHFGVVSYKRGRWPQASSLIEKETDEHPTSNVGWLYSICYPSSVLYLQSSDICPLSSDFCYPFSVSIGGKHKAPNPVQKRVFA